MTKSHYLSVPLYKIGEIIDSFKEVQFDKGAYFRMIEGGDKSRFAALYRDDNKFGGAKSVDIEIGDSVLSVRVNDMSADFKTAMLISVFGKDFFYLIREDTKPNSTGAKFRLANIIAVHKNLQFRTPFEFTSAYSFIKKDLPASEDLADMIGKVLSAQKEFENKIKKIKKIEEKIEIYSMDVLENFYHQEN